MARGRECSIFNFNSGNGCESAATTYIKGTRLQTITSQEEETECAAEKKELFSAKFPILLVISGLKMSAQECLCTAGPVYFMLVQMTEHLPTP